MLGPFTGSGNITGSVNSDPYELISAEGYSVAITCSGTGSNGTFKLQGSVDTATQVLNNVRSGSAGTLIPQPVRWFDIPSSSYAVVASNPSPIAFNVSKVYYPYLRVVYTVTGTSTGSIMVNVCAKGAV